MVHPDEPSDAEPDGPTRRPLWVSLGLWGLPNRRWAMTCMWLSLGLAAASAVLSRWDGRAAAGILFVFAAMWYWAAILWVDSHGGWQTTPEPTEDEDEVNHE